jgi:pyruvate ferredoxin oxidoreductase gamma subunit
MIEIRIHGRGGQGAVTASEIIALAAFEEGKFSQAFPKFGPERTGAPVEAFCRIDNEYIDIRTQVYNPNYLIVLDSSLLNAIDVTQGLVEKAMILINSEKKIDIKHYKVFNINATEIALKFISSPIVNTTMLGAFAKITSIVKLESIEKAIREKFPKDLADKNIEAIKTAYREAV